VAEQPSLIISHDDFNKITALLSIAKREIVVFLEEELSRATLIPGDQIPSNVVTMGSEILFLDLDTNKEQTVTLVYPHEANIEDQKISILAPVGVGLIGLKIGQTIDFPLAGNRVRRIKILSVSNQKNKGS
jgi:regulator of nucleoside diphosphate kinase